MALPMKSGRVTPATIDLVMAIAKMCRLDAYNLYTDSAKSKYRKVDHELSEDVVAAHLADGQPISVFPLVTDQTRSVVLDFDDHDGTMDWSDMTDVSKSVSSALTAEGIKHFSIRSGGGRGIHVWVLFRNPQSARTVRRFLRRKLEGCGLTVGDGPVSAGQVQIFPKADTQGDGGYGGGAIALPFARESVPLDHEFQPIELADYEAPLFDELLNDDLDEPDDGASPEPPPSDRPPMPLGNDLDEMLAHIPADDRDVWIRVGMALKAVYDDEGLDTWDRWSETSNAYEGPEDCEKAWRGFKPRGDIGFGSLVYLAKEHGYIPSNDHRLLALNDRYASLTLGHSPVVVDLRPDGISHEVLTSISERTFIRRMSKDTPLLIEVGDKIRAVNIGRYWLDWPGSRHYTFTTFDPSRLPGHLGSGFNFWSGFAVKPKEGDCGLLLAHIHENVCAGDDEAYEWVMNWLALLVQHPAEPPGTALVLKGKPGTGKGILANMVGRLWGVHFTTVTNKKHLTGGFNIHLFGRRLIFVDEGVYGGDPREADLMKVMITEPVVQWEEKHKSPFSDFNRMAFIIASNRESAAAVMENERRFTVLEVADNRANDRAYFGKVVRQMNDGGDAALLYLLMKRDVGTGPDPRRIIKRAVAFEVFLEHAPPEIKALHRALDEACLPGSIKNLENTANSFEFFDQMQAFGGYGSRTTALIRLGKAIKRLIPSVAVKQGPPVPDRHGNSRGRSRIYTFPPLEVARAEFAKNIGHVIEWQKDCDEWTEEHPC